MPTLEEVVERYLDHLDNPNTVRCYAAVLRPFAACFGPYRPITTLTEEDIEAWDKRLRSHNLAQATIMSRRKTMKVFWNWCVAHRLVEVSPAQALVIKKPRTIPATKAIPGPVLRDMLHAVRQKREEFARIRDTAVLGLLVTYGARAGDVARLPLANINEHERWIILHAKGDHDIRLPIPPDTAAVLSEWLHLRHSLAPDPAHRYAFTNVRTEPGHRYQPLAAGSVCTIVKRLAGSVCGTPYGPHSIRHWFGQFGADHLVPPTVLQMIMGHSSVHVTLEHYYNQDYPRITEALKKLDMGRPLTATPPPENKKARIIHVDFGQIGDPGSTGSGLD